MPSRSAWAHCAVARAILVVALAALCVQPGVAEQAARVRARGYVVQILSPTEFILDDFRITNDRTYRVNAEDVPGLATDQFRIGADLEIEGRLDPAAGEL